jgi:7-keto-8-aminopelargonate synthetase-like enzyme
VLAFKHRDLESFATTLQRCGKAARPIVLTDGMFSRDGSTAPLKAYLKLLPRDGLLMVDDAHGGGTLGKTGKGTVELENVRRDRIVQNITLSKAFGVYGGAILCSKQLRKQLVSSRLFAGSTPLPLPLAFAARQAVQLVRQDKTFRSRLHDNASFVKTQLRQAGFSLPEAPGPIVSIQPSNRKKIERLKSALLAGGIFPPFINYHSNPGNGYFRFVISSEHSRAQLSALVQVLLPFAAELS